MTPEKQVEKKSAWAKMAAPSLTKGQILKSEFTLPKLPMQD